MSDLGGAVERLFEPSMFDSGYSSAVVVEQGGSVVHERYAADVDATTTLISWSMAKTITAALVGVAVSESRLDLSQPAPVSAWVGDERAGITLRHLLQMRSGLAFVEDYVDAGISDCIEMLFGTGQADVAAYAVARPLAHQPGTVWNYSSGDTNIVSRILLDAIGGSDAMLDWAHLSLIQALGLDSMTLRVDAAGTFVGSSFAYANATDYARFGRFLLDDGCVDDSRILPEGFVAEMVTPQATDPETGQGYGLHTWTTPDGRGTFSANGYEGQCILCIPSIDAVIVHLGKVPAEERATLRAGLDDIIVAVETG